jgi:hypothetical protein
MVHALGEIRRTLVSEGVLIDLRPLSDPGSVEVASDNTWYEMGWLTNLPGGSADDAAAKNAFREAARRGWFFRESEQNFPFLYYWDTPEEMREYIKEKWSDFTVLEDDLFSTIQSAWATAGSDRHVRVRLKMLLRRWRKR